MPPSHEQPPVNPDNEEQGSSETALAGQYDFDIGDMLIEAWEKTDGVKADFIVALSIYGVAYLFFVRAVPYVLSGFTLEFTAAANQIGMILVLLCCSTIWGGIMMMGMNRAAGRDVDFVMSLQYFPMLPMLLPFFALNAALSILISYNVLFIVPVFFLLMAYRFVLLLIIDRKMFTWEAMEASRKAMMRHWLKISLVLVAMFLITLISALPFGIGLFWTLPMYCVLEGLLYKRIFGIGSEKLSVYIA